MVIKAIKIMLIFIVSIVLIVAVWWFLPERTPEINKSDNRSVATINYIKIGGIEQCVLVRSKNIKKPIVLFLHGGPGMPMMYLAHEFQRPLEENFTVVQWDRRGAGKTFSRNIPTVESMNVRQIINDAYVLIDTLKNRYEQDKIILVGHSFGSYLGSIMVNEKPELFSAYVSIGQVVDSEKSGALQEEFVRGKAIENGRREIIAALDQPIKPNFENWLFEFGGELKNSKSFFPLVWSGMQAPEYTLPEVTSVAGGSSFSSSHMTYNVLSGSIYNEIQAYDVPVYFMIGKFDFTTPHPLVTEYFKLISAPNKKIIYFEESAHFPFFEEPEKFSKELTGLFITKTEKIK